jgi:hypothetical protein
MGTSHSRPSRPRHEPTKNNPRSRGPNTSWKGSVRKERKRRLPEHEILVCPTRIPLDPGALIFAGFVNDCHRQSSPWSSRAFASLTFRSRCRRRARLRILVGKAHFATALEGLPRAGALRAWLAAREWLPTRRGTENKVDASHRLIISRLR